MSNFLVYGLRCPKTDDYRYIGKSSSGYERAKAHLTFSHNDSVNHWVKELREDGLSPQIDILEECSEDTLIIKEQFWIQFYQDKGCKLMNHIRYVGKANQKLQEDILIEQEKLNKELEIAKNNLKEFSNIPTFIKKRRKELKLNQTDLAEIAGITNRSLTMIENEIGNPSYSTMSSLLDILGYKLVPILKSVAPHKKPPSELKRVDN